MTVEWRNTMRKKTVVILSMIALVSISAILLGINSNKSQEVKMMPENNTVNADEVDIDTLIEEKNLKTIYLAGGCFWGVEEYMTRIKGVYDAVSGYANGNTENPSYEDVIYNNTGHAETVKVAYNPDEVTLNELLEKFFKVVDPTSLNKQGNDRGTQYRSGVYYVDENDKEIIDEHIKALAENYSKDIVVEVLPLDNFYEAEEYHQDYLQKNVGGYCHIDLSLATEDELIDESDYNLVSFEDLKDELSPIEINVTQACGTETPFSSELNSNYDLGIYVDIITGEPLFLSTDKYDSGTGWPSFTKPISPEVIIQAETGFGTYYGAEVKSRAGSSHLGHVFTDGPEEDGGLRYCINGASLRFVPFESMTDEGYGYLKHLLNEE